MICGTMHCGLSRQSFDQADVAAVLRIMES
jgi:hypothetical protein